MRLIDQLFPRTRPFMSSDPLVIALQDALIPLANIADQYDRNQLNDNARKRGCCGENPLRPEEIVLLIGRDGLPLLRLSDCLKARKIVQGDFL